MQEVIDKIIKIIGKITIADIISIIVFITILKDGRFSKKERYIRKIERCIKSQEINIAHLMYEKNIIARDFIQFHTKFLIKELSELINDLNNNDLKPDYKRLKKILNIHNYSLGNDMKREEVKNSPFDLTAYPYSIEETANIIAEQMSEQVFQAINEFEEKEKIKKMKLIKKIKYKLAKRTLKQKNSL